MAHAKQQSELAPSPIDLHNRHNFSVSEDAVLLCFFCQLSNAIVSLHKSCTGLLVWHPDIQAVGQHVSSDLDLAVSGQCQAQPYQAHPTSMKHNIWYPKISFEYAIV